MCEQYVGFDFFKCKHKLFVLRTFNFSFQKASSFRFSKRSPKKMDRLRRSFRESFRRRKDRVPESSKPHQWQADDQAVRSATCSFSVKYMGCVEVFESRGMQVCEEALKVLRVSISLNLHFQSILTSDPFNHHLELSPSPHSRPAACLW